MKKLICVIAAACIGLSMQAQNKLYPNTFSLQDVTLLDGPFKKAQDLNVNVLLQYDVDRLLAPYLKEAGLPAKAESFPNWIGLDGHVGGHYLSALAIHYAATGNSQCKQRMDYMIAELKRCQQKNGMGYVGGVPDGMKLWNGIRQGHPELVWKSWVPWYNVHKMYAGLRDAWLYGGNPQARQMFLDFCDWGISIITPLSDGQMESMLDNEFGGMDETYADAYQMTGDPKYLAAAKRFAHRWLLDSMAAGVDNLDNKHANTQVPKVVGYGRIAELDSSADYERAASFFWNTVVHNRSLSIGGNSRREHFASKEDCKSYVEDRQGPESCNTYNMLKLTQGLFRLHPRAEYADYYERALYNHILSTQHPEHGGYVYFTSARPCHYRVYSTPNCAMWCCVGSGMENHGKYGEFIYTHSHDSLFVNLFVASQLNWKEKGISLIQNTRFPDEASSRLTVKVDKPTRFKLLVRHPAWVKTGMEVVCKGRNYASGTLPSSFVVIDRVWRNGDVIDIKTPMKMSVEEVPHVSDYLSILYGPIVLGTRNGTHQLVGLKADDSRFGQIADGPLVSIFDAPYLRGSKSEVLAKLQSAQPVKGSSLHFKVQGLFGGQSFANLELEPFFRIHDSRYCLYWPSMDDAARLKFEKAMKEREEAKMILDARTIDRVAPGEQQPEADHHMTGENSKSGNYEGEAYRTAAQGGFFAYTMQTGGEKELSLKVRYWGNESSDNRSLDIWIDGHLLVPGHQHSLWKKNEFAEVEYPIPADWVEDKKSVVVKFQADKEHVAGGVFYVRLVRVAPQPAEAPGPPGDR